jgi:hypothetical protein
MPEVQSVTHYVVDCSSCKEDHPVTFTPSEDDTEWTHFGVCPVTGRTIYMRDTHVRCRSTT